MTERARLLVLDSACFLEKGSPMGTVNPKSRGAVLVVDDDEDLRAELSATLESEGYLVIEASNGKAAIDLLRSRAGRVIELVILDLVMPCMSGWDVVDLLRREPALARIPVLVTSAMPVHGDASGIGATMHWLRKPFDEQHLLDAMRERLEAARASDNEYNDESVRRRARNPLPSHHDA